MDSSASSRPRSTISRRPRAAIEGAPAAPTLAAGPLARAAARAARLARYFRQIHETA